MSVRQSFRLLCALRRLPALSCNVQHSVTSSVFVASRTDSRLLITRYYAKGANRPKHTTKEGKPKVQLSDQELMEVVRIGNFRGELEKCLQRLQDSYVKHLSLHAVAGSLDTLKVTVGGQDYVLAETAQISKKNPQLIVLNLAGFPDAIKPVLKAVQESGLNISTQQDGTSIYLHLPKMTREHRENLAKNAKTLFMKAKEEVLAVERKYVKEIQKNKEGASEDTVYNATLQIKMEAENSISQAEAMMKTKQKELLGEK